MENKYTKDGVNINTYNLIFNEKEEYKQDCSKEILTIEMSSKREPRFILKPFIIVRRIIEMYYHEINYLNIQKRLFKKGYIYSSKGNKFEFDYLEKYLRKILKYENSYVKKQLLIDIKSRQRYSTCYKSSMIISSNIENSYLVTGLIEFEDGTTHLHSYVEYNGYVIDYTKDLIIKKEKYYELLKVKEINRISSNDIPYIFNLMLENNILNTTRFLATFGNEIAKELEKNKQLIKIPTKTKANFSLFYW